MTYTGLELFMENLKQLIHSPLTNTRSISSQRPQFQLLYQELGSMIQTLFVDQGQRLHNHELQKLQNLKTRFKHVAEEAQDIVDLFVSSVDFRNKGLSPRSDVFKTSLNLEDVMRSIKSIKAEFMSMMMTTDLVKMDSSRRTESPPMESAADGFSSTRNPIVEEIVVGLDDDTAVIVERLTTDRKQLNVVSIVGMGGLGKTTLANKVFNDPFVVYHFHVRAWVTVSQTYEKRDLLVQILESIDTELNIARASDFKIHEMLHRTLKFNRYLIVIDDIWSKEAWDDLKLLFPNDNTGSRILLTSRHKEVALHAKSHGFIHHLPYLTENKSWELLRKKVFHGDECPEYLIESGMQIARNCHGLPLAVVLIAGILARSPLTKDSWERIARSVGSYIVSDPKGYMETLSLSFDHLPCHLRDCFLYLGGFPEDHKFRVRSLIWLWMSEGFIQEAESTRSLEDTAEAYLMDLVDRNLLIVVEKTFNGRVKAFKVHDLVRKLCLEKAEERFLLKLDCPLLSYPPEVITPYKHRRVFANQDFYVANLSHPRTLSIRSLLCFHKYSPSSIYEISEYFRSFALLRVLDLQNHGLTDFPKGIALLVHLRYLAIWHLLGFPSSICNLWRLQTLIVKTSYGSLVLPCTVSDMANLRHLSSNKELYLPSIGKPMNLQSISHVVLGDGVKDFHKCFPRIKKLASTFHSHDGKENDFLLPYLETLKLTESEFYRRNSLHQESSRIRVRFPTTLRKLTLVRCRLPWSDMSVIQSLPKLEALKLIDNAFEGPRWDVREQRFQQLKYLRLEELSFKQWEACSASFPCLKRLAVWDCGNLEEIPFEIGYIPTLELIETDSYSDSVVESAERIQLEQHAVGNNELKITVDGMDVAFYLSMHKDLVFDME